MTGAPHSRQCLMSERCMAASVRVKPVQAGRARKKGPVRGPGYGASAGSGFLAVFLDQRLGRVEQLLAVEAALVQILYPFLLDQLRLAREGLRLLATDDVDFVAPLGGGLATGDIAFLLDATQPGRGLHAGV